MKDIIEFFFTGHGGHSHEMHELEHKESELSKETAVLSSGLQSVHEEHEHKHGHDMGEEHNMIGISLVFGFVFMLLVDQIGGSLHSHSHGEPELTGTVQNRNKITATLGLVVHAAGMLTELIVSDIV